MMCCKVTCRPVYDACAVTLIKIVAPLLSRNIVERFMAVILSIRLLWTKTLPSSCAAPQREAGERHRARRGNGPKGLTTDRERLAAGKWKIVDAGNVDGASDGAGAWTGQLE